MPVVHPRPAARLPDGAEARPARPGGLEAVVALCVRCDVADLGGPDTELDDIGTLWRRPGYEPEERSDFDPALWFLAVDGQNRTGATRLYERAGMRTQHRHDYWIRDPP